ncbi:hypothetical protein V5P93_002662 [Actinokineospora auranticolor]|uniref:Uncharacterized protein n=1 Tax=Actinokineospora auranticolor TaxID=155976 RepID=A0A2S6GM39_9PSEU|nr:hypothetical protein [Actinokineospora auranticolor]PPK66309.1 hypothetical protein CLV40_11013 [Actinokineospora auranticolor]
MPTPPSSAVNETADAVRQALALAHPTVAADVVTAVVYQAAGELVGRSAVPADFGRLLRRRANARLAAMTGILTPIRTARP